VKGTFLRVPRLHFHRKNDYASGVQADTFSIRHPWGIFVDDILKSIVLGIVEGITEFLPISSTGHLIVGTRLLAFRPELQDTFEIFIQAGAIVAVLIYYARELMGQARHANEAPVQRWWLAIVVAAVPGLLVGFLFRDQIKEVLFNPTVVAMSMIVGGVFIYVAEWYQARAGVPQTQTAAELQPALIPTSPTTTTSQPTIAIEGTVSLWQALAIGLFQVLALIPGMSRSAMSIIGGMFVGLSRPTATRFSFYLAIPVLGGATAYELIKEISHINSEDLALLLIGAVVSGLVAWGVIAWLLRYVARHSFVPFAIYRILLGLLILALVAAGLLTT
jgi:undecaprenyl-diphosphatase